MRRIPGGQKVGGRGILSMAARLAGGMDCFEHLFFIRREKENDWARSGCGVS